MLCSKSIDNKCCYYFDDGTFTFCGEVYTVVSSGWGPGLKRERKWYYRYKNSVGEYKTEEESVLIKRLLTESLTKAA